MHLLQVLSTVLLIVLRIDIAAAAAATSPSSASPLLQPAPSTPADVDAPTHSWLLALRLLDGQSKAHLPLVNTSVLVHARLQSCRPTIPASPLLLPPSLRSAPCTLDGSCGSAFRLPYAQLECIHVWAENWMEWTNIVGLASIPLTAPAARFAGSRPEQRSQMSASTKRMQLRLMKQSPAFTASDLIWMDMMDFDPSGKLTAAARARGEREFDPQGLAAVRINGPGLPGFKPELETRQLLWPFNPADPVHELDLTIWPRPRYAIDYKPHPFLPASSRVSEALSLLERLKDHVLAMQHWWHIVWLLPLCVGLALGLLRLSRVIRKSSAMREAARRCIDFGELAADAERKLIAWLRDRVGDRGQWIDNAAVLAHHVSEIVAFSKERVQDLRATFLDSLRGRWEHARNSVVTQLFSTSDFVRSKVSQLELPTFPPHLYPGALLDRLFEAGKAVDAAAYSALALPIIEAAADHWLLWTHSAREAAATMQVNLSSLWDQLMNLPVFSFFDSLSRTVATAIVGALSPSPPAPFVWEGEAAAEGKSLAAEQEAQNEAEVAAERELFGRPEFELQHGQPVAVALQEDDGREHFQDLLSERERIQLQQKEAEHKAIKIEEGEAARGEPEHKQPEQPAPFGWQPLQMDVWSRMEQAYAAARPTAHVVQQEEEKLNVEEEQAQQQTHEQQQS